MKVWREKKEEESSEEKVKEGKESFILFGCPRTQGKRKENKENLFKESWMHGPRQSQPPNRR